MARNSFSASTDTCARSCGGPRWRIRAATDRRAALPHRVHDFGRRGQRPVSTCDAGRSLALHILWLRSEWDEPEAPASRGAQLHRGEAWPRVCFRRRTPCASLEPRRYSYSSFPLCVYASMISYTTSTNCTSICFNWKSTLCILYLYL